MNKKFKIIISTSVISLIILIASLIPLINHRQHQQGTPISNIKPIIVPSVPTFNVHDNAFQPFTKDNLTTPISSAIDAKIAPVGFAKLSFDAPDPATINLTSIEQGFVNVKGSVVINDLDYQFVIVVIYQYDQYSYKTNGLVITMAPSTTTKDYQPFAQANIIGPIKGALATKLKLTKNQVNENKLVLDTVSINPFNHQSIIFDMITNISKINLSGSITLTDNLTYNFALTLSYNFNSNIANRYSTANTTITRAIPRIINGKNPFSHDNLLKPISDLIKSKSGGYGFSSLKFKAPTKINVNSKANISSADVTGSVILTNLVYQFSIEVVYQYQQADYAIANSTLSIANSIINQPFTPAIEPFSQDKIIKQVKGALSTKLGIDINNKILNDIKLNYVNMMQLVYDSKNNTSTIPLSGSIVLADNLTYDFQLKLSYNFNSKILKHYQTSQLIVTTTNSEMDHVARYTTKDNARNPFSHNNLEKPITDAITQELKKQPFSNLSFDAPTWKSLNVKLLDHKTTAALQGSVVINEITYHFSMTIVYYYQTSAGPQTPLIVAHYETSGLRISAKLDSGNMKAYQPFSHDNLKAPIEKAITDKLSKNKLSKGETFDNLLFNAPNQVDIILKSQQLAQSHITGSVDIDQVTYKIGLIVKYHYDSASYESNSLTMTAKIDGLTPWNPPISGIVDNAKYPFSHNNLDVPIRKALNDAFNSKSTAKISFTAPTITDITFPSAKSAYATIKGQLDIDTVKYQFSIKVTYQYDNERYLTDSLSINTGSVIDNAMQPTEPAQEIFSLTTVKAPVEAAIQKHFPNGYSNIKIAKNAQGGLAFDKVSQSENNNISSITVSGTVIDSQNKKVNNFTVKISFNFTQQAYHHNQAKFSTSADSLSPTDDIFSRAHIDNQVRLFMAEYYQLQPSNTRTVNSMYYESKIYQSDDKNSLIIIIKGSVITHPIDNKWWKGQDFYQFQLEYNKKTSSYSIPYWGIEHIG